MSSLIILSLSVGKVTGLVVTQTTGRGEKVELCPGQEEMSIDKCNETALCRSTTGTCLQLLLV